jgi:pyridoxamine 5'-phosphate oxidase
MEKVGQLFGSGPGHADKDEQTQGSGGGGPVEAVWWVEGETQTQWRIKGRAFVVGNDIEGTEQSSGVRTVLSEVGKRMRVVDAGKEGDWSWGRELTASFGNQSPGIKGRTTRKPTGFTHI